MRCEPSGCQPVYWCPTVKEYESPCHGGFDTCCSHPELHRCCSSHTEPGEAKYTCHSAPGVTDPCCNSCHYWVAWNKMLDGEDEDDGA